MQKKPNILRLLSAPGRYIKLRISSIYKKLVKKTKKKLLKCQIFQKMKYMMKKSCKKCQQIS